MDPATDTDATNDAERAELQDLSARLAARGSVMHYAVALGASFFCFVAGGITVKLGIDLSRTSVWFLFVPVGALTCASLAVAVRGFWRGTQLKRQEHEQFRRLLELRAKAGLS